MSSSEKEKEIIIKTTYATKEEVEENKKKLEKNIEQIISKNYGGASVKINY